MNDLQRAILHHHVTCAIERGEKVAIVAIDAPAPAPRKPYVARHTRLHPALWAPYKITFYPGFKGAPGEDDLPAVWMPEARIISRTTGHAASLFLDYDSPSLDAAIESCWEHYASLH